MVTISWILIYMLQLDYIYMIGHPPTDWAPTVGTLEVYQPLLYYVTKDENSCRVTLRPVRSPCPKFTNLSPYIFCSLYGNSSAYVLLLATPHVAINCSIRSSSFLFCHSPRSVLPSSSSPTCTGSFTRFGPIKTAKRAPAQL